MTLYPPATHTIVFVGNISIELQTRVWAEMLCTMKIPAKALPPVSATDFFLTQDEVHRVFDEAVELGLLPAIDKNSTMDMEWFNDLIHPAVMVHLAKFGFVRGLLLDEETAAQYTEEAFPSMYTALRAQIDDNYASGCHLWVAKKDGTVEYKGLLELEL